MMITFKESLNSTLPWGKLTWTDDVADVAVGAEWFVNLMVDEKPYGKVLTVGLYHKDSDIFLTKMHKPSTAFAIYSTIAQIVKQYINDFGNDIRIVQFTAAEPKMAPVYKKLAPKLASFLGGISSVASGKFQVALK